MGKVKYRLDVDYLSREYISIHAPRAGSDQETEGRAASYGELAGASKIVPDWLIFDAYASTLFSPNDFFCGEEVTPA